MALLGLMLGGGYVIGMFLALKWERAGVILGGASGALLFLLLAFFLRPGRRDEPQMAALAAGIIGFVYFLPVVLYLLCWWLADRDRKRYTAAS